MSHRAPLTNLQGQKPLSTSNNQNNSSNESNNNLPLHNATLRPLRLVSHRPNNPSIKPMDNLPQGKMEALLVQALRHDNTPPLSHQQPGGKFLSPNDELQRDWTTWISTRHSLVTLAGITTQW